MVLLCLRMPQMGSDQSSSPKRRILVTTGRLLTSHSRAIFDVRCMHSYTVPLLANEDLDQNPIAWIFRTDHHLMSLVLPPLMAGGRRDHS